MDDLNDQGLWPDAASAPALGDLVDVPVLQSMMDDFYTLTSIPMSLIDLKGTVVVGAGWQRACTQFHRVHPETCEHCIESDTVLTADIPPGEARLYRCENGMWDAATPIIVGGVRVGNLFTGQFFFDGEDVDEEFFRAQAARYGFAEDDYLASIADVPRLTRATIDIGLRFLTNLSTVISQLSYSNLTRTRAEAQLQNALASQMTLTQAIEADRGVLQAIMDNTDTHLAYLDRDFNFVAANTTYAAGSGHPLDELIGRNHFDLFPNKENEEIFQHARETGEAVEYRAKPFVFEGQSWRGVTYWDWRLTPVKDRGGAVTGFAFSLMDVTRPVRQKGFSDAINRLNEVIHANLELSGLLERIAPELALASGAEVVAVLLRAPSDEWRFEVAIGMSDEEMRASYSDEDIAAVATAVRLQAPVMADRECGDEAARSTLESLGLETAFITPLTLSEPERGVVIYGYQSGPGEFDADVADFAGKIASSLSLALGNARLIHDAKHSARLSGTLAKVNEILLSVLTPDAVVARLVGEVSVVAGADRSLVIRVHGDEYTITHVRGVDPELIGQTWPPEHFPAFALTASSGTPVLIEDNWTDPRTNKGFVKPYGLRSFQLLPLTVQDTVTGVLALVFDEPQSFDEEDCRSAERMAAAMSAALESARLYENEHRIADRLQEALLALPQAIEGIDFAHAYHSASEAARVGGDFYDVFELGDYRIGLTIGDVTGKGLDAAALTSLAKNAIRAHASEANKPVSRILSLTNDVVYRSTTADTFVTLFFGILDLRDGRLVYANAGHPAAALLDSGTSVNTLDATGPPLGAMYDVEFTEGSAVLGAGCLLFLHTDGLTEARSDQGFYGEQRLYDLLPAAAGGTAGSVVEEVITDVLAFTGGRLTDDLAILAVKRAP